MRRNLSWMTRAGVCRAAVAYLLGLERTIGREAVVTGKPAPGNSLAAVAGLGLPGLLGR